MKLRNPPLPFNSLSGFSEYAIRKTAGDICRILTAYGTLDLLVLQELVSLERDAILVSLGWLAGQGVICLETSDDGLKVEMMVHHD